MIFNLGKFLVKYGILLLFILILSISIKINTKNRNVLPPRELSPIVKNDSSVTDLNEGLAHITARKTQEYDSKNENESHSSLNSVNLVIYMIYQVTNKSLK